MPSNIMEVSERDKKGIKNHIIKMSIECMQKSLMCHVQVVHEREESKNAKFNPYNVQFIVKCC